MKIKTTKVTALVAALAVCSSITAFAANGEGIAKAELIAASCVPATLVESTEIPEGAVAMQKVIITDEDLENAEAAVFATVLESTEIPEGAVAMQKVIITD